MAGPGYVLPAEALAQVQNNQTRLSLSTATFPYADFAPEIELDEVALKTFYNSQPARYEIPERIQASYVIFPTAQYIDQVDEASDEALRAHFIANRTRFVEAFKAKQPKAVEAGVEPTATFEDVKDAVAAELAEVRAKRMANEAAQEFAYTLYTKEIKRESAGFNKYLNENGLSLTTIEPYTATGASRRSLPTAMLQSAFALSDNRYYSDAYALDDGFAVLIYQGRIDAEIPPFEAVADEVATDYKSEEKRRLYSERGLSLQSELTAALAEGKTFEEATSAFDLSTETFEPFIVEDAPVELNQNLVQQALSLKSGSISPMIQTGSVGTFIYLASKEIPEISDDNEDFTQARDFLSRYAAYLSANSLGGELVANGLPEPEVNAE
jgi:peptidyl-prolyl cis-trans isomerase D